MGWLEDITKALPTEKAYDDLLHPVAKELGNVAENTLKAARLVIAPIDYLAAQQDRYKLFLGKVAKQVPEEQMIPAHPQIAGQILDNIRYIENESIISDLYANLLARAIDNERVSEAHPAFVNIINQLSPDEALIIGYFFDKKPLLIQESDYYLETNLFGPRKTISNEFPEDTLAFPENYLMYTDHLHSLNIAGVWQEGNQEPIHTNGKQSGVTINSRAHLTSFGELFAKACLNKEKEA